MKAVKIKDNIYWVGAIDWDLRNFHGYLTQKGSTYNAYLIVDDRITLIDTVKVGFTEQMLGRISDVCDPSDIDFVISNHVEMDHSGSLPAVLDLAPDAEVITSPNGEKGLRAHFKKDWKFKVVKTGDILSPGKRSLQFVLTPMVHWPDNMVCYMPEEKILFSNDAFGQHYASSERFDDECQLALIMEQARKYYANIVLPYSSQVGKALKAAEPLDIDTIAPSHGIIWRKHLSELLEAYQEWSSNSTKKKCLVVYDSMWKSTEMMAQSIGEAFEENGYHTVTCNLQRNHISDVMTEFIDSEYICVGSPTLNNHLLPTVAAFLTYLMGLSPKGRKAFAFGSYGWGGQSVAEVASYLKDSGFEVLDSLKVKYIPGQDELDGIREKVGKLISG
ncbi:FprA family A-type flavoprotein [Fibrobacterota bacterium]